MSSNYQINLVMRLLYDKKITVLKRLLLNANLLPRNMMTSRKSGKLQDECATPSYSIGDRTMEQGKKCFKYAAQTQNPSGHKK